MSVEAAMKMVLTGGMVKSHDKAREPRGKYVVTDKRRFTSEVPFFGITQKNADESGAKDKEQIDNEIFEALKKAAVDRGIDPNAPLEPPTLAQPFRIINPSEIGIEAKSEGEENK